MTETYSVAVKLRGEWVPTDTRGAHKTIAQEEAARWRALGCQARVEREG